MLHSKAYRKTYLKYKTFTESNFGLDLTPEAIFIGALDPTVGEEIVAGRITTAQIGGEAARAGFSITGDLSTKITKSWCNTSTSKTNFTSAEAQLPQLQELQAQRGVEARTIWFRRVYRSSSIPKSRGITTNTKT